MDTEELMKLAAEKAVKELDWESIEYLLKPTSVGELLLRLNYVSTVKAVINSFYGDNPLMVPKSQMGKDWKFAMRKETFYQECKKARSHAVELFDTKLTKG